MLRITFIAAHSHLFNRLIEIFHRPGVHITVIGCPATVVSRSPFVDRFIPIGMHDESETFVEDLIRSGVLEDPVIIGDWVIVAGDDEMRELARSGASNAILSRVLPVSTPEGMSTLGSKVNLSKVAEGASIPQPRTLIAQTPDELMKVRGEFQDTCLIKADSGGAGLQVRLLEPSDSLIENPVPIDWFPVVVQDFIDGTLISVEALFRRGSLIAYQYSEMEGLMWDRGPSSVRRYTTPLSDDFATSLQKLAAICDAHGLANCTFIRVKGTHDHLLIEADLRPNVHCQFGPQLGLDWAELMVNPPVSPLFPADLPSEGRIIRLYPLDISRGISQRSVRALLPWILRRPGTWDTRNHADPSVNAAERRLTYKKEIAPTMLRIWRLAPAPLQLILHKLGLHRLGRWVVTTDPTSVRPTDRNTPAPRL
jgi:hypothetical protein